MSPVNSLEGAVAFYKRPRPPVARTKRASEARDGQEQSHGATSATTLDPNGALNWKSTKQEDCRACNRSNDMDSEAVKTFNMNGATSQQSLLSLFRGMLKIRLVEEKIAGRYSEQEMRCPVHLCIGQEAVAVGVCANLSPNDYVLSGHRSHGHYLAKGGNLKTMLAEIYGKELAVRRARAVRCTWWTFRWGFLAPHPL